MIFAGEQEMAADTEQLQTASLQSLAENCAQQTQLFYHNAESDTRFCFELFRRALLEKCQEAWTFIYEVYSEQIVRWVHRHPGFSATGEPDDVFVNRALEKFWQAVSPERFANFPDLTHLLRYLQMCVHSVICDFMRSYDEAAQSVELSRAENSAGGPPVEDLVQARHQAMDLWKRVCGCLRDQKEVLVAYDSFVLDLKPAEIHERYPLNFESVREVYRIKENVLERLRRDPGLLAQFLAPPESDG
jgi:DNA-directed RNA polymerase specialized sigma24 family protein